MLLPVDSKVTKWPNDPSDSKIIIHDLERVKFLAQTQPVTRHQNIVISIHL